MARFLHMLLLLAVGLFGSSVPAAALTAVSAAAACPTIPSRGPLRDFTVFNLDGSRVDAGNLVSSMLFVRQATVHSLQYHGKTQRIGSLVPCDVPNRRVHFPDGRSYGPECFQCVAVSADFAVIESRQYQSADGPYTNYDSIVVFNASAIADNGERRFMESMITVQVTIQQRQVAFLPRYVRWHEDDSLLHVHSESYLPDVLNPNNVARASVVFRITFPPHVVASAFWVDTPPSRAWVNGTAITGDCVGVPQNRNCSQTFSMVLRAPWDRYTFSGKYVLALRLDCRLVTGCPDFESGRVHKLELELETTSWKPTPVGPPYGLINELFAFRDADHTDPVEAAFSWGRDGFFIYHTRSEFNIQSTHLEFINITHTRRGTSWIWNGDRVNTDLIKQEHLDVQCPPPVDDSVASSRVGALLAPKAIPKHQCHFRFMFDRHDPLWDGATDQPYFPFNIHVHGLVEYKKYDSVEVERASLSASSGRGLRGLFSDVDVFSDRSDVPESGRRPIADTKTFGLGEDPDDRSDGGKDEFPLLFYSGVGLVGMGVIILAAAVHIRAKARADQPLLGRRASSTAYGGAGSSGTARGV